MPKYIAARIQLTNKGWSVQAQNANDDQNWTELHIYKNPYPNDDLMTKVIRNMAKTEACALAQSLSKNQNDIVTCYDENGCAIDSYKHGLPERSKTHETA